MYKRKVPDVYFDYHIFTVFKATTLNNRLNNQHNINLSLDLNINQKAEKLFKVFAYILRVQQLGFLENRVNLPTTVT